MIEIKVPTVGESISEVTLLKWTRKEGEYVQRDEVIAELESEKATFEVNAEKAGLLHQLAAEGDTILIGSVLARIDETAVQPASDDSKYAAADSGARNTASKADHAAGANIPQQPVSQHEAAVLSVPNEVKATPVASAIIADKK